MSENKYVLIKSISVFEHTYIVPLREDMRIEDHLDYVTCNDIEEIAQAHIDENILPNSTRVLSEDDAIELFDRENDYLKDWSLDKKLDMIHRCATAPQKSRGM